MEHHTADKLYIVRHHFPIYFLSGSKPFFTDVVATSFFYYCKRFRQYLVKNIGCLGVDLFFELGNTVERILTFVVRKILLEFFLKSKHFLFHSTDSFANTAAEFIGLCAKFVIA